MDEDTAIKILRYLGEKSLLSLWQRDQKFKATRLEEAVKAIARDATSDSGSPLFEHGDPSVLLTHCQL